MGLFKRTLLGIVLLAALTGAGLAAVWWLNECRPFPSESAYRRIHSGMTRAAVEELLGPPGDYCTRPVFVLLGPGDPSALPEEGFLSEAWEFWHWDWGQINIGFDFDTGRVCKKELLTASPDPAQQTLLERIFLKVGIRR